MVLLACLKSRGLVCQALAKPAAKQDEESDESDEEHSDEEEEEVRHAVTPNDRCFCATVHSMLHAA